MREPVSCPVRHNSVVVSKTTVTTTATKIVFPEEGNTFRIYHIEAGEVLWIGGSNLITTGSGSAPMNADQPWDIGVPAGNYNSIYGVVSAGTIDVYVVGYNDN